MFCFQCEQTAKGEGCTKLGVCGKAEVRFYGRTGGMVPNYDEIVTETSKLVKEAS